MTERREPGERDVGTGGVQRQADAKKGYISLLTVIGFYDSASNDSQKGAFNNDAAHFPFMVLVFFYSN